MPATLTAGQDALIRVHLRNTGARAGHAVVQLYLRRPETSLLRPARWLAGFAVVPAAAGSDSSVDITIPARSFAHWDTERSTWTTEPGSYVVEIGSSSSDLPLAASIDVVDRG